MSPASLVRSCALVVLCGLIPSATRSQEPPGSRIQGVVIDSITGAAISRALVMLDGGGESFTDPAGRYSLNGVAVGEHLLAVVTSDCRIAAVRLTLDEVVAVRLDVEVGLERLPGVTEARTRARSEGTALRVATRDEIQRLGERSLPAVLRRIAPSMVGAPDTRPGGTVDVTQRGVSTITGSRTPLILLDGVRVSDVRILDAIDPGSVTRIEIAAGPAGGWAHGNEGVNGFIHIHTHSGDPVEEPYCGATARE